MPRLTIDGQEVEVAPGTTILQACLARGREIPHYCYHDGLSIAGNCRMCLVDVEKQPKLVIGCYTPVADGMVVHTENEKVRKARAAMMEFFLINHPLDCPICDEAGECRLQEYAVTHGSGKSRYTEPKLALAKAVDIGEHVTLDQERCIQCSRCIRFCDEITKTGELGFFERGERSQIGIFPGRRLDNPYSGNVVDICPVGALTLKEFRFKTRVWYLRNTSTICAGCARGCNVVAGVGQQQTQMTTGGQLDDRIKRIVPRVNLEVNAWWICDEGRLSYEREQASKRLTTSSYDEEVRKAASALAVAGKAGGLGAVLSPRLVCEDVFAWTTVIEAFGGGPMRVHQLRRGEDDDLLIRADKGANSTGASWIVGPSADPSAFAKLRTLLVVGDTLDAADTVEIDADVRAQIVYVGPFVTAASERAVAAIPAASWSEADGTFVNFEGRAQRVRRCHLPMGEARPGWRIALDLLAAAGLPAPAWTSADDVLAAVTAKVPPLEGVTPQALGLLGVPARGTVGA